MQKKVQWLQGFDHKHYLFQHKYHNLKVLNNIHAQVMDCMWSTTICKECELLCCKAILAKLHHHTWQVTAEAGYWQISEVLVLGAAFQPINLLVQNHYQHSPPATETQEFHSKSSSKNALGLQAIILMTCFPWMLVAPSRVRHINCSCCLSRTRSTLFIVFAYSALMRSPASTIEEGNW